MLGIGRYYNDEKLIALFNFGDYSETAWINEEGEFKDLIAGTKCEAKNVVLEAHDFRWMALKYSSKTRRS